MPIAKFEEAIEQYTTAASVSRETDQHLALCSLAVSAKRIADSLDELCDHVASLYDAIQKGARR